MRFRTENGGVYTGPFIRDTRRGALVFFTAAAELVDARAFAGAGSALGTTALRASTLRATIARAAGGRSAAVVAALAGLAVGRLAVGGAT